MAKQRKQKAGESRPRDPFWRWRRALGQKRKESAKAYRRAERRKAEKKAREEHE